MGRDDKDWSNDVDRSKEYAELRDAGWYVDDMNNVYVNPQGEEYNDVNEAVMVQAEAQ